MEKNKVEISAGDFFTQKLQVGDIQTHSWAYCSDLCMDKKVLHIGCSDYPIFNLGTNMHLKLVDFASELHGCDPNGLEELKGYYDGIYFKDIAEVDREYDVVLVPNIIEHLENPGALLKELFKIKFKQMFVLVPNYSIYTQASYQEGVFTERIHPDHFAWYSPYTLWNLFKKYMEALGCTYELNFFDNGSMISILIQNGE